MATATETATQKERRLIVRAGLFVGLALVLFGFVVLLIGKENRLFDRQVRYQSSGVSQQRVVHGHPSRRKRRSPRL